MKTSLLTNFFYYSFNLIIDSEVEWSDWSECSTSCGPGTQTRYLKCKNSDRNEEPCPLYGTEHLETRQCNMKTCPSKQKFQTNHKHRARPKNEDVLDNDIDVEENVLDVLKNHQVHEGMLTRKYFRCRW